MNAPGQRIIKISANQNHFFAPAFISVGEKRKTASLNFRTPEKGERPLLLNFRTPGERRKTASFNFRTPGKGERPLRSTSALRGKAKDRFAQFPHSGERRKTALLNFRTPGKEQRPNYNFAHPVILYPDSRTHAGLPTFFADQSPIFPSFSFSH